MRSSTLAAILGRPTVAPPVPPGPLDRLLPGATSLNDYTTPYNATYGNIIVRVFGVANSATATTLEVSWNGVVMDHIGTQNVAGLGKPVASVWGVSGGLAGTRNLRIRCLTGSLGNAAVRIGELSVLPIDYIGAVEGASPASAQYYNDIDFSPVEVDGVVGAVAGWTSSAAYPIYESDTPDVVQWNTQQPGMSAYFSQVSVASSAGLWVFQTGGSTNEAGPSAIIFELKGAVL